MESKKNNLDEEEFDDEEELEDNEEKPIAKNE